MSDSKLLICNCNKTMPLDAKALGVPFVHSELCRRHIAAFEGAAKAGEDMVVACTQEAPLFSELHNQWQAKGALKFVNIRETAGWSAEAAKAGPKIAALLALAEVAEPEPVATVSYQSGGQLLVIGQGEAALSWAERLADTLQINVLINADAGSAELPATRKFPVQSGRNVKVSGWLGAFDVTWQQHNPIDLDVCTRCNACVRACPEQAISYDYQINLAKCKAHRNCVKACGEVRAIDFERAEKSRSERYDMVLDLSAEPLLKMHQLPQGYLAPGRDPLAQSMAASQLARLVGEFEKPKFFAYREKLCAHARSNIAGCTKCIDVCSAGAISPDGDKVKVEAHLCMGCGGCATVCPSGAMGYAYPRVADVGVRVKTVLNVYRKAGGASACLLIHNGSDGKALIEQLGRRGKGLPAHVIPIEVHHVGALGIDAALGSIALGAAQFVILSSGSEAPEFVAASRREFGYAQQMLTGLGFGDGHLMVVEAGDMATFESAVWNLGTPRAMKPATFNLSNDKRMTLDFVFDHLIANAPAKTDEIALAAGAPFGRVSVNKDTCTLCMSCVGACPEGALLDSKQSPQLRFIERNCVQCGLCQKTCPENAISLASRLLLDKSAKTEVVLNEAEPFHCVRCAKPFGAKQMISSMTTRLTAHSMFAGGTALRRLQMCADCRVIDMMEEKHEATINDFKDGLPR